MTAPYLPDPVFRALTSAGLPLAGGLLYTYAAGSSTPQATYGADGTTVNANPVVLDTTGAAIIRLNPALGYKFVLHDAADSLNPSGWTIDNYLPYGADAPVFSGTVTAGAFTTAGAVTAASLSTTGNATIGGTLTVTGAFAAPIAQTIKNAGYTFGLADAGTQIAKTDTNPYTYAIPQNATTAFPIGTMIEIANTGTAGNVTVAASGAAAYYPYAASANGTDAVLPKQILHVRKVATDVWIGVEPVTYTYAALNAFTATLQGCTAAVTGTVSYTILNGRVILTLQGAAITGTSNATSFTFTGLPAACQANAQRIVPCILEDNTTTPKGGWASITNSGTVTFGLGIDDNATGFTNSGTKGLPLGWTVSYPL